MQNSSNDLRMFGRVLVMSALFIASASPLWSQNFPNPTIPGSVPATDPLHRNDRESSFPRLDPRVEELRRQRAATDRLSHLRSDSVRLVELCNQLKTSLNDHPNLPTEADRKLMQDIEKLAKNIRSRMTE